MVLSNAVFWHQLSLGSIWLLSWKLPLITFVMLNMVFTYDHGQMASCSTWPVSEQSTYALKCVCRNSLYADDSALVAQSLEDLQAMLDRHCGYICGVWPYYQHEQNRGTLPACPWHSTQGSWSIHTWRTNQICPKLHLLRMCGIIRQLYWLRDHKTNTECCKCVWSSRCSSVVPGRNKTCNKKCKLYRVFVLPCLLYSTDTYTMYQRHLKKLTSIQLRHLRSIMGLTWRDRVCNGEVLQRSSMESVEAILVKGQLRWAGHVVRMPDDRLPKAVFYGELTSGKRKRGGQKLRYKDVLKRHLKAADMDVDTWREWCQKIDLFGGKRSLMLVTPLKERKKRSTWTCWKDGGKDTPEVQLKTAFIEIVWQPMMMMMMNAYTVLKAVATPLWIRSLTH